MLDILGELAPQKLKLYDYSEFILFKLEKLLISNTSDIPSKLLIGVIYLYPKKQGLLFIKIEMGK